MSAIIGLPASPVAAGLPAEAGSATDAAGGGTPFDSLFRQLLRAPGGMAELLADPGTPGEAPFAASIDAAAPEDLGALLPFLEAMGLTIMADSHPRKDGTPRHDCSTLTRASSPAAGDAAAPGGTLLPAAAAILPGQTAISAAIRLPGHAGAAGDGAPAAAAPSASLPAGQPGQGVPAAEGLAFQAAAAVDNSRGASSVPGQANVAVPVVAAEAPRVAAAATEATPSLPVARPFGAAGWSEEVGNRVTWMATRMESRAELVLTPPQLGRVEVSLSVRGELANASFVSANPAVREALEAALPRLREILAEAGIQLGQAQVGAEHRGHAAGERRGDASGERTRDDAGNMASSRGGENLLPAAGLKSGRGLVDVFA